MDIVVVQDIRCHDTEDRKLSNSFSKRYNGIDKLQNNRNSNKNWNRNPGRTKIVQNNELKKQQKSSRKPKIKRLNRGLMKRATTARKRQPSPINQEVHKKIENKYLNIL